MLSSTHHAALFLAFAALLSQTEAAAPPSGELSAVQWFPKPINNTHVLGIHDTSDGCPVGWVECSVTTCYPVDGSTCCSDGNYCPPGEYCDGGGCCPNGQVCSGVAPPPSTVGGGPTFTTSSILRPTTSSFLGISSSPSVSVGFSVPGQTTNFGSVTFATAPAATTTAGSATFPTGLGIGTSGAATVGAWGGLWLAGLVAVVMCIA